MKPEGKRGQSLEAGGTVKKRKEKRSRGDGWYGEVTSHWYSGGGRAWASQKEGVEVSLKTVKILCVEDDLLVENRAKRKCVGCSD